MATLSSPSLGKLLTNVRNFLNSPNSANSFWSDQELTEYLNQGVQRYFVEVSNNNEGQFITKTSLDIVSGAQTIALPTDCFIIKAVRKIVSTGAVALQHIPDQTLSYDNNGGSGSESYFPSYTFRGNNLVLSPTPGYSETGGIELEYMQFPGTLQDASDTLTAQVPPIFKELLEMYAVYKAKLKESLSNGVALDTRVQTLVDSLYHSMQDALRSRSMQPTFIKPFNPEG